MEALTVSECVRQLNSVLETQVLMVEGEVQEYSVSRSRWVFFALRDAESTLECFVFAWRLKVALEDGMTVRVLGTPGVHPRSGRFRFQAERVELVGEGSLKRAYEQLSAKLAAEGLFAEDRKRPLPAFPERIGLVASRESAAYSDFLKVLESRWGGIEVVVAHVPVQGPEAPGCLVEAFTSLAAVRPPLDTIVVTRGGGSRDDLQAFNTEAVARAIFRCGVPVIVAVGHERDMTIADLVADVRASTPTHAAEIIVPDRRELQQILQSTTRRLWSDMEQLVSERRHTVNRALARVVSRVEQYNAQAMLAIQNLSWRWRRFTALLDAYERQLAEFAQVLPARVLQGHTRTSSAIQRLHQFIAALNPQRLLRRGYSIVRRRGRVVKSAAMLRLKDTLSVTFTDGDIGVEVIEH